MQRTTQPNIEKVGKVSIYVDKSLTPADTSKLVGYISAQCPLSPFLAFTPIARRLCLGRCRGTLMRTLLTRDKGRNSLVDLVEGLPSFRIECSRDEGPVLVCPLPTFHRQESHRDGGQDLVLSNIVLLRKGRKRHQMAW